MTLHRRGFLGALALAPAALAVPALITRNGQVAAQTAGTVPPTCLRRKIGAKRIETSRGLGYRLVCDDK